MNISKRGRDAQASPIRRLAPYAEEATRQGVKVYQLNIGQPDLPTPDIVMDRIRNYPGKYVPYAPSPGIPEFREGMSRYYRKVGLDVSPAEVLTTIGGSEALQFAFWALFEPGDEVIIFEPFYENYGPDCILSGAVPRYVALRPPDWAFDPDELAAAFNRNTRAIVINTPHNPTGKVYTRSELELIARLCIEHDAIAITDEIYEHLVYTGEHVSIATLPGMPERTITISGASKTYSVTGWRVGWIIAPPVLSYGIRKVHDFLTVGAAHPLQMAVAAALDLPPSFYVEMRGDYLERRDAIVAGLNECGFEAPSPAGAYYVMAGIGAFPFEDDVAMARHLIEHVAVATVPGSSFYHDPKLGQKHIRFSFPKKLSTIERGVQALKSAALNR
jgi:aminotransferase